MNALILSRLVLAYLARVALGASAADIASALFELESDIQSAFDGMLIPQGYAEMQPASSPAIYTITPSGAAALLNAPNPGDVSPELQPSIDIVFSEGVNPDATFLPDQRGAGFTALDARDLSYLVAEYGIGASIESGDLAILVRCARGAKLAGNLAARL